MDKRFIMGRRYRAFYPFTIFRDCRRHSVGKIKVFGISLGITLVLFVGIILGHFGFTVNHNVIHFFKEFGLILFVYSVGMQVGPGFFSSFRQGGITLNMLACGIVFLGVATALVLHFVTGIPMPTMVVFYRGR